MSPFVAPLRPIAIWVPRDHGAKLGHLVANGQLVARDISRSDAQREYPEFHVCRDRDGRMRNRDLLERNGITIPEDFVA